LLRGLLGPRGRSLLRPPLGQDLVRVEVLLHSGLEILGEFLALVEREPRLLVDLDDLDVLVLASKHEVFAELIASSVHLLERGVFLELLHAIGISEGI